FKAMATFKGPAPDFFDLDRDAPLVKGKMRPPAAAVARAGPVVKMGPAANGWQGGNPKEGGVSLKEPGTAEMKKEPTPGGGQVILYLVGFPEKKLAFVVHYQDVPADELAKHLATGPEAVCKAFMTGFMASIPGSSVKKESPVTVGKHPGRQYDLEIPGQ